MASLDQIINEEAIDSAFLISELVLEIGGSVFPVVSVTVNASLSDARIGGSACSVTIIPTTTEGGNGIVKELATESADAAFEEIQLEQLATVRIKYSEYYVDRDAVLYSGYIISKKTSFNTGTTSFKKSYDIVIGHPSSVLAARHVEAPYMWDNRNGSTELSSLRNKLDGLIERKSKYASSTSSGFDVVGYIVELLDQSAKMVGDAGDLSISSIIDVANAPKLNSRLQFTDAKSKMPLCNSIRKLICSGCLQNSEWTVLVSILNQLDLIAVPTMDFDADSFYTAILPNLAMAALPPDEIHERTLNQDEIIGYYQEPPTRAADRKRAIAVYVDADDKLQGSGTSSKSQSAYCMFIQGYDENGKPVLIDGELEATGSRSDKSNYYKLRTKNGITEVSGLPINRITLPDWVKTPKTIGSMRSDLEFRKTVAKIFATSFYMSGLVKTGSLEITTPFPVMLYRLRYLLGKVLKVVLDGGNAVYGQLEYINYSISADSKNFKVIANARLGTIRNQAEQDAWSVPEKSSELLFITS